MLTGHGRFRHVLIRIGSNYGMGQLVFSEEADDDAEHEVFRGLSRRELSGVFKYRSLRRI